MISNGGLWVILIDYVDKIFEDGMSFRGLCGKSGVVPGKWGVSLDRAWVNVLNPYFAVIFLISGYNGLICLEVSAEFWSLLTRWYQQIVAAAGSGPMIRSLAGEY